MVVVKVREKYREINEPLTSTFLSGGILWSKNRLGSNGRLTVRLINKMREIAATAVPRAQPCNKWADESGYKVYCTSAQEIWIPQDRSPSRSEKARVNAIVLYGQIWTTLSIQHLQDTAFSLPWTNPSNIQWSQINTYIIYGTPVEVLKAGSSSRFLVLYIIISLGRMSHVPISILE